MSLSRPEAARAFLLKIQSPFAQRLNLKQLRFPYSRVDGGAERDRTVDPLLAKQVLSQLSYSPLIASINDGRDKWWAWVDSNYRPHPYQGCALTN